MKHLLRRREDSGLEGRKSEHRGGVDFHKEKRIFFHLKKEKETTRSTGEKQKSWSAGKERGRCRAVRRSLKGGEWAATRCVRKKGKKSHSHSRGKKGLSVLEEGSSPTAHPSHQSAKKKEKKPRRVVTEGGKEKRFYRPFPSRKEEEGDVRGKSITIGNLGPALPSASRKGKSGGRCSRRGGEKGRSPYARKDIFPRKKPPKTPTDREEKERRPSSSSE